MKRPLFILLISSLALTAHADSYSNFVRQTEYDTFVQWDVPVADAGAMRSPQALGDLGSAYELWSVNTTTGAETALDQEFVADYSPVVEIEFETGDPYSVVPRTRVDQPIRLRVSVSSVNTSGSSGAIVFDRLRLLHEGFLYSDGVVAPQELGDLPSQFSNEYSLGSGSEIVVEFPVATLAAQDMTKTAGVEMFHVEPTMNNNGHGNNADDRDSSNGGNRNGTDLSGNIDDETFGGGNYIVSSVMEQAALQIWPVAEATLGGLDPARVYDDVPPITVDLVDLYPESTTYLRVYKGGPSTSPSNPITIGSSAALIHDSVPQDRTLVIENLDDHLPSSGSYTVEVVHETPFGIDILSQFHPLRVEWRLEFRGNLTSK